MRTCVVEQRGSWRRNSGRRETGDGRDTETLGRLISCREDSRGFYVSRLPYPVSLSVHAQILRRDDRTGVARRADLANQAIVIRAPVELVIQHQQLGVRAR